MPDFCDVTRLEQACTSANNRAASQLPGIFFKRPLFCLVAGQDFPEIKGMKIHFGIQLIQSGVEILGVH